MFAFWRAMILSLMVSNCPNYWICQFLLPTAQTSAGLRAVFYARYSCPFVHDSGWCHSSIFCYFFCGIYFEKPADYWLSSISTIQPQFGGLTSIWNRRGNFRNDYSQINVCGVGFISYRIQMFLSAVCFIQNTGNLRLVYTSFESSNTE
jgi:hypothetical protein